MKADPKPRRDGTCAVRTCRKPLPDVARDEGDPFCTSACCREFHGVTLAMGEESATHVRSRVGKTPPILRGF